MATGDKRYHPMRMLIILTVLIGILIAFSGLGAIWGGGITPKFALDLAGGTQIILTPTLADEEVLTEEALDEAIAVIRQRVDASGVSEAEITKQGAQNIVVGIPGETPSDETIELISKAAQMRFRPVILSFSPVDETETLVNQKTLQDYAKYYASLNNSTSDIIQDIVEGDNTAYDWTPEPSDQATTPSDLPTEPSETSNTSGISSHSISYSYNESNASQTQSYNPYVGVWTDHLTGEVVQVRNANDYAKLVEPRILSESTPLGETASGDSDPSETADSNSTSTATADTDSTDSDSTGTDTTKSDSTKSDSTTSDTTASTNSYWNSLPLLTDATISADAARDTPSGFQYLTEEIEEQFKQLDCTDTANLKGGGGDSPDQPLVTCSRDGFTKYLLGPVAVEGTGISQAASGLRQTSGGGFTNEWVVSLQFNDTDMDLFIDTADRVKKLDFPRDSFAIVLDGLVISAPTIKPDVVFQKGSGVEISGGSTGFTQDEANTLANQLSFGALPLNFTISSKEQVSASLGSEQLEKGLMAGLIGLLLVVIYSMIQYFALGSVTVGSLGVSAILTYLVILVLSWLQGYRLSLPGIIGIIVAIGITADSFIVYFERIRDELRDGRPLNIAINRAWHRAVRTIAASDAVNLLCAVVLYFLAVGGVRGFAFTLGLTTVIDFIVVVLFTHPVVTLLSKKPFFALGHPLSGLNPERLGAPNAVSFSVAKHDWLEKQLTLHPKSADSDEFEDDYESETEEVGFGKSGKTSAVKTTTRSAQKSLAKSRASRVAQTRVDRLDDDEYYVEQDDWEKEREERKAEKQRLKAQKIQEKQRLKEQKRREKLKQKDTEWDSETSDSGAETTKSKSTKTNAAGSKTAKTKTAKSTRADGKNAKTTGAATDKSERKNRRGAKAAVATKSDSKIKGDSKSGKTKKDRNQVDDNQIEEDYYEEF